VIKIFMSGIFSLQIFLFNIYKYLCILKHKHYFYFLFGQVIHTFKHQRQQEVNMQCKVSYQPIISIQSAKTQSWKKKIPQTPQMIVHLINDSVIKSIYNSYDMNKKE
jgi:hypothetical protein